MYVTDQYQMLDRSGHICLSLPFCLHVNVFSTAKTTISASNLVKTLETFALLVSIENKSDKLGQKKTRPQYNVNWEHICFQKQKKWLFADYL